MGADRLSIQRLRKRLPFAVFVLLLILFLVMLGVACLCMSDHPTQAADRAISVLAHSPALIEMWALMLILIAPLGLLPVEAVWARERGSPARLQRFLF
jgi:hypothetical protein